MNEGSVFCKKNVSFRIAFNEYFLYSVAYYWVYNAPIKRMAGVYLLNQQAAPVRLGLSNIIDVDSKRRKMLTVYRPFPRVYTSQNSIFPKLRGFDSDQKLYNFHYYVTSLA